VRELIWQGLLSYASSAALDEMFGASVRAAAGYAQAAMLGWLLRRFGEGSPSTVAASASRDDAASGPVECSAAGAPADAWGGSSSPASARSHNTECRTSAGEPPAEGSGQAAGVVSQPGDGMLADDPRVRSAQLVSPRGAASEQGQVGGHTLGDVLALRDEELRVLKGLMNAMDLRHAACVASRPRPRH
jgi:hypothetical protein